MAIESQNGGIDQESAAMPIRSSTILEAIDGQIDNGIQARYALESRGRRYGTEDRNFVFLEAHTNQLLQEGILKPLGYDTTTVPYENIRIALGRFNDTRLVRMSLARDDSDSVLFPVKAQATTWRLELQGDGAAQGSTTIGYHTSALPVNPEALETFTQIIDRSEPPMLLEDYLAEFREIIGPHKYKIFGREIEDEGFKWSPREVKRAESAIKLAWKTHAGQRRESGEPYIVHPWEGAMHLLRLKVYDPDMFITTIIHDVLEDDTPYPQGLAQPEIDPVTGVAPMSHSEWKKWAVDHIAHEVGKRAARWTVMMSRPKPDGIEIHNREEANNLYYKTLRESLDVSFIKVAADRWQNVETLEHMPVHKIIKTIIETRKVYIPLLRRTAFKYPQALNVIVELESMLEDHVSKLRKAGIALPAEI